MSAQEYTITKKVRYNYKKYLMKIQNNLKVRPKK